MKHLPCDVNLKFNKPEVNVTIDREKAESLGISVIDCSNTTVIKRTTFWLFLCKMVSNISGYWAI
jgi:hypothetical protein